MSLIINNRVALGSSSDLTTPTSTRQYRLGSIIEVEDTDYQSIKKYMYVKSHGALTAYQPYVINASSTAGSEVITAAPFTIGEGVTRVCVPQVAFTSGYFGWVQIVGDCSIIMTAETYAVGDFLQLLNAGTAPVVDGTSSSTTHAVTSFAIAKAAGTTAVAKACLLLDVLPEIAAA